MKKQSRIEGEIQQMEKDFPITELWQIFNGEKTARNSDNDITVFDSVGFALEDFSTLRYLYDKISENEAYCEELNIIGELDDSRNLFGLLNK